MVLYCYCFHISTFNRVELRYNLKVFQTKRNETVCEEAAEMFEKGHYIRNRRYIHSIAVTMQEINSSFPFFYFNLQKDWIVQLKSSRVNWTIYFAIGKHSFSFISKVTSIFAISFSFNWSKRTNIFRSNDNCHKLFINEKFAVWAVRKNFSQLLREINAQNNYKLIIIIYAIVQWFLLWTNNSTPRLFARRRGYFRHAN